jgi:hypothetical protein
MPRCSTALALCGAIDEVRESIRLESLGQLVRIGRPHSQLDHIRALLESHDEGCWVCRDEAASKDR